MVDMVFEHANDPSLSLGLGMVPVFAVITVIGLGLLVVYLRAFRLGSQGGPR